MRIAFLGLGAMGRPLAVNLARHGHTVQVYDVRAEALAGIATVGLTAASDVASAVAAAEVICTSLPDTPQVTEVLTGPGGVLSHAPAGALAIDFSTIAPAATRALAAQLASREIALLDAPVSGGVRGAEAGKLTIMVGGDLAAFTRAAPVFAAVGQTITHFGPSGSGQVVKLCNQIVCSLHIQAVCEAFSLGQAAGIDLAKLRTALLGGAAASWILDHHGALILARDDRPLFRIDLQAKDLRLVQECVRELRLPLPGVEMATQLYQDAQAHGDGGLGNQSLYREYERRVRGASATATAP